MRIPGTKPSIDSFRNAHLLEHLEEGLLVRLFVCT